MTPNEYQSLAARTLLKKPPRIYSSTEIMAVWTALGMAGEAGEAADYIKKCVFHDHPIDMEKLIKELGDVLWYVSGILSTYGLSLEEVMYKNIKKLEERYPYGFNSSDSINRKD